MGLLGARQVWNEGNVERPGGNSQALGANVSIKVPRIMSGLSQGLSSVHGGGGGMSPNTVWKQEVKELPLDPGFFWDLTKQGSKGCIQ